MAVKKLFAPIGLVGICVLIALTGLVWIGCSSDPVSTNSPIGVQTASKVVPDQAAEIAVVMSVQNRHAMSLEAIDGVVGTATGRDEQGRPAVLVLTERPGVAGIPRELDGTPVRVLHVGTPSLFPKPPGTGGGNGGGGGGGGGAPKLTKRDDRPVNIGYSIGNYTECAAGTFGCVVNKGGNMYILSNNHVLARQNAGQIGELIGQPGLYDNKPMCSGYYADSIGRLAEFVEVQTGANANNTVDCAIALTSADFVDCATDPYFYGLPNSTPVDPELDMAVQKVGRNGHSEGTLIGINATVTLTYAGATTRFVDQILTTNKFSKSGDSGSLIVTNDANVNPVGLLFAGTNDGYTWGNKITNVLSALNVTICGD
jgi:hypothetical protein